MPHHYLQVADVPSYELEFFSPPCAPNPTVRGRATPGLMLDSGRRALWPAVCLGLFVGCLVTAKAPTAMAQAAFAPPPLPPSGTLSNVRGVYNPSGPPPSPATVAIPVQAAPAIPAQASPGTPPALAPPSGQDVRPTSTTEAQPLAGGEIVARVDGQIVLASDVLWQVNQIIQANRASIPPQETDKARRILLRQQVMQLVDTKLLYSDFLRKVPPENIPSIEKNLVKPFEDMEIPRLVKTLRVKNRHGLIELLDRNETSIKDLQRQFSERTIAGEWLRQLAPKPKPVTHEELLSFYSEHQHKYEYPAQAKWEEAMIRFGAVEGNRAAAWEACAHMGNEIWQQVARDPQLRGAVFAEIVKNNSHGFSAEDGGVHKWTTQGALRCNAINEALFTLEIGQMSNIIESEDGFHIIRVLDRKDAGRTPFTEAQAEIRKQLQKQRQRELVEAEMVKLRKKSRVWTIFDGDLSGPRLEEIMANRDRS
ncbi:MAG: peptidylprolyl isomerase [Pirellulales bacterium]|nr:peptidylprolyl isomerase [Pirellulales bacterium]